MCVLASAKLLFNDPSLKPHLSCRYQQTPNVHTSGWAELLSLASRRALASALTYAAHINRPKPPENTAERFGPSMIHIHFFDSPDYVYIWATEKCMYETVTEESLVVSNSFISFSTYSFFSLPDAPRNQTVSGRVFSNLLAVSYRGSQCWWSGERKESRGE